MNSRNINLRDASRAKTTGVFYSMFIHSLDKAMQSISPAVRFVQNGTLCMLDERIGNVIQPRQKHYINYPDMQSKMAYAPVQDADVGDLHFTVR